MTDDFAITKAASRKAFKDVWQAEPPFPIAADPSLWSKALAAAACAGSTLNAALALAQHGVPVFPLRPADKKPLNAHGVYGATTDPTAVRHDFCRHPDVLIAVPTGRRTGVVAIDVDASPPHAHDGIGAWRDLGGKNGATPTRIHKTPSGGMHLLYRWREDRPVGCPIRGLPEGVECKGEGGSLVFPPSVRGGKRYEVVKDVEPAAAPEWLLDLVAPINRVRRENRTSSPKMRSKSDGTPYGLKALENVCAALANAGPGERDRAVGGNVLDIGSLAAGGELDARHTLQSLKDAGRTNVGAGAGYVDKIERAFERGMESPRTAPKPTHARSPAGKRHREAASAPAAIARTEDGSYPPRPSCPAVPDQGDAEKDSKAIYDGLVKRIGDLNLTDEAGARAMLDEAIGKGLSDFQVETLIVLLNKNVGFPIKPLRNLLSEMRAKAAEEQAPGPMERAQAQKEDEDRRKCEVDEKREALWQSCHRIAQSQTLLADMEAVVHKLGVVRERGAILATYLTATSRLCRRRAISLLRRGAAASGKNHVADTVFKLIPEESIVPAVGGSPKALAYFGGVDAVDALKHKVLYIPEAAAIADRHGAESEFTTMLRVLISEGRIVYQTVQTQEDGPPITVTVTKNGPIAVVITSARANIEEEMMTRLMVVDADESDDQTRAIIESTLAARQDAVPADELERWLKFQRWLELGGPYDVNIPFLSAIMLAHGGQMRRPLRYRRDISNFITAIMASAIIHSAQRKIDDRGRVVADLDDYEAAHEAFDRDMGSLYSINVPDTIKTVVRVIESMVEGERLKGGAEGVVPAGSAKVTYDGLMAALGINSNDTAGRRLKEALRLGLIEQVEPQGGGLGKTTARRYRVLVPSIELEERRHGGVFPSPDAVRNAMQSENCTAYTACTVSSAGKGEGPSIQETKVLPNPGDLETAPTSRVLRGKI